MLKSSGSIRTRLWYVLVALSILCLSLSASPTYAQFGGKLITSYSADMVMIQPDGAIAGEAKLYITPEAYRMDGMLMGAGQHGMPKDMTTLGLKNQNRQYVYNHDKKLVYESEFDEEEMMKMLNTHQNVDSEVVLGKEQVSGYMCTKKKVTTTTKVMGRSFTSTQTVWQSDRFEMPLRTLTEEGYMSELRNIDTKRPSSRLFEPLTGYTRVGSLMAVMGMDFGGGERPRGGEQATQTRTTAEDDEEAGVVDMLRDVGKGVRGLFGR